MNRMTMDLIIITLVKINKFQEKHIGRNLFYFSYQFLVLDIRSIIVLRAYIVPAVFGQNPGFSHILCVPYLGTVML